MKLLQRTNIYQMHIYNFEKLDVWQLARQLSKSIYEVTEKFPSREKYGLTTQIRRAAVSIASNIAGGSARNTPKDQNHFYTIAYGSLIEVLNQIILAHDLHILLEEDYIDIRSKIEIVSSKIFALKTSNNNKFK